MASVDSALKVDDGLFVDRAEIVEAGMPLCHVLSALQELSLRGIYRRTGLFTGQPLDPSPSSGDLRHPGCREPEELMACSMPFQVCLHALLCFAQQGDYNLSCGEGRQLIDNATWYRPPCFLQVGRCCRIGASGPRKGSNIVRRSTGAAWSADLSAVILGVLWA